jgi:hypothetical protein
MKTENQKFVKVMNRSTGQTRLVPVTSTQMQIGNDETVIPFSIKEKWMTDTLTKILKQNELQKIKARLENIDQWARDTALSVPQFLLAEEGKANHPGHMTFDEIGRFRRDYSEAISFYAIGIQYLEKGLEPDQVQKVMEERHLHVIGRDAFVSDQEVNKEVETLLEAAN